MKPCETFDSLGRLEAVKSVYLRDLQYNNSLHSLGTVNYYCMDLITGANSL